jgi:hypothetical protein
MTVSTPRVAEKVDAELYVGKYDLEYQILKKLNMKNDENSSHARVGDTGRKRQRTFFESKATISASTARPNSESFSGCLVIDSGPKDTKSISAV